MTQAGTPELCDASPTNRQIPPSWRTPALHPGLRVSPTCCQCTECSWCHWFTSFIRLLQTLSDPLHRFGSHFGAKVSVKRRWSAPLWAGDNTFLWFNNTHYLHSFTVSIHLTQTRLVCQIPPPTKYERKWLPDDITLLSNLLHVTQDVLPAVKDTATLLRVQLVDEVSREVLVTVFIPEPGQSSSWRWAVTEPMLWTLGQTSLVYFNVCRRGWRVDLPTWELNLSGCSSSSFPLNAPRWPENMFDNNRLLFYASNTNSNHHQH